MNLRLGDARFAAGPLQSERVAQQLREEGHSVELIEIKTSGDRHQDVPFEQISGSGLFVRELESALLEGRVDLAVHSYKDLHVQGSERLGVAAVTERLDAADVLLVRGDAFDRDAGAIPLRRGATVGTSSARRRALIGALRSDLTVSPLRGNLPTRVRKLAEGHFDAIVLAGAGLERMARGGRDLLEHTTELRSARLDPEVFVPAPFQGAIAVQVDRENREAWQAVATLDDVALAPTLAAERELLRHVDGDCNVPFGAWARTIENGSLELFAVLERDDVLQRAHEQHDQPKELADRAWSALEAQFES